MKELNTQELTSINGGWGFKSLKKFAKSVLVEPVEKLSKKIANSILEEKGLTKRF